MDFLIKRVGKKNDEKKNKNLRVFFLKLVYLVINHDYKLV